MKHKSAVFKIHKKTDIEMLSYMNVVHELLKAVKQH